MEQTLTALQDMALFVEVARSGSFRQAAGRLGIPPSTLSRRIAALERRLGLPLLLRTSRSVTLTSAATPYYERCLDVVEAATRAQDTLQSGHAQPLRLRVSMPVDLGVDRLGPLVASFAAAHPGLRVEFDLSSRAVDLMRDPVDLAFRIGKPLDERVVARRITVIPSGLYAAPALLRRLPPVLQAAQLATMPCLDLRTANGSMPWKIGSARWPAAPGPCHLAANSVGLLRRLAVDGHGIALLPHHVAARAVHERQLMAVLPDESAPEWPLFAVSAGRTVPARARQLIEHVRQALGPVLR
ncbi:MAG: LysR family transcriptional regulator [Burkholderiales bacterium]|nr:LysR family transcriptional regulator [Burkholderiales bacterium]